MKHTFFLAASGAGSGLTSVALGVFRALDRRGIKVGFCKPISQEVIAEGDVDPSISLVTQTTGYVPADPIPFDVAERYVRNNNIDDLMERIVGIVGDSSEGIDVLVVEGLLPTAEQSFPSLVNSAVASALSADVIIVNAMDNPVANPTIEKLQEDIETAASLYGGWKDANVIGCIINKVKIEEGKEIAEVSAEIQKKCSLFHDGTFQLIGCVPWNDTLPTARVSDVAKHLDATIINAGEMESRRVRSKALAARNLSKILYIFDAGRLLIAPVDRIDILITAGLASVNQIPLAGIVLTSGTELSEDVIELCRPAFEAGLPVLAVESDSFVTATQLSRLPTSIPADDIPRFNTTLDFVARHLWPDHLQARIDKELEVRLSPAAFRHQLSNRARQAKKRIVLPEGTEPRTIIAATMCESRGLARCVLLGDPIEVRRVAEANGVDLGKIEIIDPDEVRERYLPTLLELRKHKKLTEVAAREALEDTVMIGTLMLALDEVDGLVSGAVHSTANTIRPALQLIKTAPEAKVVSSVFFMCLPDQVLVYGDCAVNPDPDAETLADIAIQSADSALSFGIQPRVALISYSTGSSGSGADVEKVRAATKLAQEARPEMAIDGPLQYDAAAVESVGKSKAPDSEVAGHATVFIFPDLNTGNTTYKAVQRSANVTSIGPMLQGLRKPVNDLSRGALVDDIVYTIALTAVQADR